MSLTFEEVGEPIAEVGENKFLLYIDNRKKKSVFDIDKVPAEVLAKAAEVVRAGADGKEVMETLAIRYGEQEGIGRELTIPEDDEDTLMFIPKIESECVYIAGAKGLGKTYICKKYACLYKEMFPDNEIILVSRHDEDPTYEDCVEMNHILADERIFEQDWDLENLRDKLIIFDDMDTPPAGSRIGKFVKGLVEDIISNGRKYGIHMIYVSHLICDREKTRCILNQADKVVIFPSNSVSGNERYMKTYAGLKKYNIEKINRLDQISRWACICTCNRPAYVVHEKGAFLL